MQTQNALSCKWYKLSPQSLTTLKKNEEYATHILHAILEEPEPIMTDDVDFNQIIRVFNYLIHYLPLDILIQHLLHPKCCFLHAQCQYNFCQRIRNMSEMDKYPLPQYLIELENKMLVDEYVDDDDDIIDEMDSIS
jgi:hypothetical protein